VLKRLEDCKNGDVIRQVDGNRDYCVVGVRVGLNRKIASITNGAQTIVLSSKLVEPVTGHFVITPEEVISSE
jgi:hypothetical protein